MFIKGMVASKQGTKHRVSFSGRGNHIKSCSLRALLEIRNAYKCEIRIDQKTSKCEIRIEQKNQVENLMEYTLTITVERELKNKSKLT
jgi:hypothetical protein